MQPLVTALAAGGPWGIVTLVVVSLIRGWLIPLRSHNRELDLVQRALAAKEAEVTELQQQVAILLGARKSAG